jgi:hypothetical protein
LSGSPPEFLGFSLVVLVEVDNLENEVFGRLLGLSTYLLLLIIGKHQNFVLEAYIMWNLQQQFSDI